MIRDLSQTLRMLLTQPGAPAELAAAQIVFDRPTDSFNPQQASLDLFLYDVRENAELRSSDRVLEQIGSQIKIRPAPLRVSCSYLVTAWPGSVTGDELALQEQRLLSQALQVLAGYAVIPAEFLQGDLVGSMMDLPLLTARADGLSNPHEFWGALGGKLRPSLALSVTLAMPVFEAETAFRVITGEIRIGLQRSIEKVGFDSESGPVWYRIGGQLTDTAGKPVSPARVSLVEAGLTTGTDGLGRYSFGMLQAGTYTLRVEAGSIVESRSIVVPAAQSPAGSNYNMHL